MMIGQKIVVVGGTAGIGLAVTRNAADCGAEVYIGSSNAQKLESTLSALQGVRGALVDVGNEESVAHFFSGISEIDYLVSTVGPSHRPAAVIETPLEEAQALYKIKFWGQFLIAKHGAPRVQHNGSITLTSGILSARPAAGLGVLVLVSCPRNKRYIAGGQLAVFQGASEAPISESYGSSEQRGKTANWPRPKGLR
jgi:NAD(P)-dependent dehydrogenase (short-subunit alcohol dehydrogenase family)